MSSALDSFATSSFDAPVHSYRREREPGLVTIGSSFMRFEPPDLCFVSYVGDLDGDVVYTMNSTLEEYSRGLRNFFMMVDLSQTGNVSDVARRFGVNGMRALNPCGTAVFGADFHRRVIATLITKAASVIDARIKGPVCFFAREKEARAWLDHIRKNLPRPRI